MACICREWTKRSAFFRLLLLSISLLPIYLFVTGFFTSKIRLEDKSTCELKLSYDSRNASPGGGCIEPRFKRAVFILIDALRSDFCEADGELAPGRIPHYYGKLSIFDEYERFLPGHARGFRLVADPPTTTYQRLQAIISGTIPTFVEAGSNFFAPEAIEDNLLYQIQSAGGKTVVLGDDTWGMLFPSFLSEKTKLFPSLDTTDIHSVDDGILSNLSVLRDGLDSWKLLVLHFLGVDHVGHTYGPDHPEMESKLIQMNSLIRTVFETIDDDTIVFVFGDHGMDSLGGHGGDSPGELNTFLFSYSKSKLTFGDTGLDPLAYYLPTLEKNLEALPIPDTFDASRRAVSQVDMLSTISLLLGLPIPYSNVGSVIPEFFLDPSDSEYNTHRSLSTAVRINSHQISKYIDHYRRKVTSTIPNWRSLRKEFDEAEKLYGKCLVEADVEACKVSALQFTVYNKKILASARESWAVFDNKRINVSMILGVLSLVMCIEILVLGPKSCQIRPALLTLLYFATFVGSILIYGFHMGDDNVLQYTLKRLESIEVTKCIMLATIVSYFMGIVSSRISGRSFFRNITCSFRGACSKLPLCGLVLYLVFIIALRSNSYIVAEDFVTMYILQTLNYLMIAGVVFTNIKEVSKMEALNYLLLIVSERLKNASRVCREEHGEHCVTTFYAFNTNSVSPVWLSILRALFNLSVIGFHNWYFRDVVYPSLGKKFLSIIGSLELLSSLYYALGSFCLKSSSNGPEGHLHRQLILLTWMKDAIADLVLISQLSLFIYLIVLIVVDKASSTSHTNSGLSGMKYYKIFLVVWSFILLTQKPMGGIVMGITLFQIMSLLKIFMKIKKQKYKTVEKRSNPSHNAPSVVEYLLPITYLYFISWNTFYTTGHQATLASIHWNSAFIGITSLNWMISPLLVLANTFGGQIIAVFSIPLLVFYDNNMRILPVKQKVIFITRLFITSWLYSITACIMTMLHTAENKRTLFAWKIFAPKFLIVGAATLMSYVCTLISSSLGLAVIEKDVATK